MMGKRSYRSGLYIIGAIIAGIAALIGRFFTHKSWYLIPQLTHDNFDLKGKITEINRPNITYYHKVRIAEVLGDVSKFYMKY